MGTIRTFSNEGFELWKWSRCGFGLCSFGVVLFHGSKQAQKNTQFVFVPVWPERVFLPLKPYRKGSCRMPPVQCFCVDMYDEGWIFCFILFSSANYTQSISSTEQWGFKELGRTRTKGPLVFLIRLGI